ncbi:hypothetical protein K3495_g8856 [Podosphaera aphanis]|nr:hypothetical protein K3495_g8856 [Podosphaera aphanis]
MEKYNTQFGINPSNGMNNTHRGSVEILIYGNFASFNFSVRGVLSTAGVRSIVDGTNLRPRSSDKADPVLEKKISK